MTTSSNENVNASRPAATMAGISDISVTRLKTRHGGAPRSAAASSMAGSRPTSRDWTISVAYAEFQTECPMIIAVSPSLKWKRTKRKKTAVANTTSGTMMRAYTRPS